MGWIDRWIGNNINKALSQYENRTIKFVANGVPVWMEQDATAQVEKGYMINPDYYSIVGLITAMASQIEWYLYEVKDEKALRKYKSYTDVTRSQLMRAKALVEYENAHPLKKLLNKPNPLQGWSDFVENAIGFRLITGNQYVYGFAPENGVNAGKSTELFVLPSHHMQAIASGQPFDPVAGYTMDYKGNRIPIEKDNLFHGKYWNPNYEGGMYVYGLSPLAAGGRLVTRSNAAYTASTSAFQNGMIAGMITGDERTQDASMTIEQFNDMQNKVKKMMYGADKKGKIFATSANVKWQQMGLSPVDLNIIEGQKMDLRAMCNLLNMPAQLFNDAEHSTYNNMKEARKAAWSQRIVPELTALRNGLNNTFVKKWGDNLFLDFDISGLEELQDDMEKVSMIANTSWWLKPNEKRVLQGYGVDEDEPMMDEYWLPTGIMPMSDLRVDDLELDKNLGETF
jgi:HK97 family phage portal protein